MSTLTIAGLQKAAGLKRLAGVEVGTDTQLRKGREEELNMGT